ncbi:EAL domain-containing protein [Lelliottia nimipressuralis]|nr:EAL domain-containing protein [Lelliottia nimipressuralis]
MNKMISHLKYPLHHDIEYYRLEPFIDLSNNRIIGYEVLSQLKHQVNVEQWFARLSGRQQIDLLLKQISCVSESVKDTCFYNLSVEGFLFLTPSDIDDIATFDNICLEVADSSLLKSLTRKEHYVFYKNIRRLQTLGVGIWVDDFCVEDLISLPDYYGKFDGIKIDSKEMRTHYLGDIIHIVKNILGDIPVLIEGVESKRDLEKGMCSGANLAQGYYWSNNNKVAA